MKNIGLKNLIRPLVRDLHAYVPGEEPPLTLMR
jgi:hypothetical protein